MKEYASKSELIGEIRKTAEAYIGEFQEIAEADKGLRLEENERTPYENLAYQLGWMALIKGWEQGEAAGEKVEMPAPGVKWNQLGPLHQRFYAAYAGSGLAELSVSFRNAVDELCVWLDSLDEEVLLKPDGRKWASSPANWPVSAWVHINTVAPFKSFRAKIRRWKKLRAAA